jgi:uncharacterized protein
MSRRCYVRENDRVSALPVFRFHPHAYELGLFEEVDGVCDACGERRALRYTSSFYSRTSVSYLCPWCIADGTAARTFAGQFNDSLGIEGIPIDPDEEPTVDLAEAREVSRHTPSYLSWQQEQWRSHCGRPCAFLGYVDSEDLGPYLAEPAFAADVDGGLGWDAELIRTALTRDGDLVGCLFRCLTCGAHRLHVDAS